MVFKNFAECWRFLDTGKPTPDFYVENLASAFAARQGKDLQHCDIVEV